MKNTTKNLMIAAALLVATGVASAQAMKADVPFAFRAGNTVLAAGTYRVEVKENNNLVFLSNQDSRRSIVLMSTARQSPSREWKANGEPVMAFECGAGRCQLVRVWTGSEDPALSLPHSNYPKGQQPPVLTLIRLVR